MVFGIDDAALIFGGLNAGMGFGQSILGNQAAQQDYKNQKAMQSANNRFAQWQSEFNVKQSDLNNQFKFWQEKVNYAQELAYTNSLRNVELIKAGRQATVVGETRAAAGAAYAVDSQALSNQYQEASMSEAVALQQYRWRALQTRESVRAGTQEGNSVDRIVNDYARQEGDYAALQQINQGIRTKSYSANQAAQQIQYLSRYNSQTFYDQQPYIDPIPPFAPLPTLMGPSQPYSIGAAPGGMNIFSAGSAVLGGVQSAMGMQGQLNSLRAGK